MNKWLIFGGGFVSGFVVCFAIFLAIGLSTLNNGNNDAFTGGLIGATYFEQPTETIEYNDFEVLQVIQDNAALVKSKELDEDWDIYTGPIFLMVNNSGRYYYDDEKIKVPSDSKVVQLGIYRYEAKSGSSKTVPIIGITKK